MSAATAPSLVDRVIDGRYRVRSHLADGGMASVYVAVDERLEREVALKVMRPDLARDEEFVSRFRREARAAARLGHPNVVAVYDQGNDEGYVFLAMELVTGRTLRQVLSADGPLTPRAALDVLESVLQALAAAHRAGIIHRDVKPENVLLGDDGVVKVADFGLARAVTTATRTSHTDVLLGTAAYLSPEQVERGIADARSDVYAAGLLLFEMLTGRKAFPGDSPIHVAYQHVHGTVPTPSDLLPVPRELDALVALATARDPDHRPADAAALLQQVRRSRAVLEPAELDRRPAPGEGPGDTSVHTVAIGNDTKALPGSAAPAPPPPGAPDGRSRRRRPPALVAAVLVVALVAGGAWWFLLGPGARTTVPALAGKSRAQAVAALDRAHLDAHVHDVFSEHTARGRVVTSEPGSGQQLHRGSAVDVALSKGPQRFRVPDLAGRTQQQAVQLLTHRHLTVGQVTEQYDEHVPAGQVVTSSPGTGRPLKRGTAVSLVVSKGQQPIPVPSVVGKSQDDAVAALKDAGFAPKVAGQAFSDSVPQGAVVSQDPADGTLHRGDPVQLTISKGPQLFPVPDVTFKNEDTAKQILQDAGFSVQVKTFLGGVLHVVRLQDPSPGTKVPHGTTITITVI
ncbi:MAG TPA: Stk1 family PASTA domain-containing Ser/Thr kinase [Segeticoccus sp.]|uniref:Stk1 family PASTA domain-containing Ser/Thr kinase n=1 Tax=Segeticoccus sp. TaxID=2706531 RepID=UPI002D7F4AED|nr:Stk1 family PASTA domain-containing Ser/Thr kinase [Segeticoccus sp.]HET8600291.1 Stk1 family PASTA domain-containing Ser/Thr kinase [Segeticoccus sp.]